MEPWLQSHICEGQVDRSFFPIYVIGVDQLCARRKPIGRPIGARIGGIPPICARYCAWSCTCAGRPSQFLCMHIYTHAPNGFVDSPKHTACTLFHGRHFIDTDERRFLRGTFLYCCTPPQIPLHIAQKTEDICIIPQHSVPVDCHSKSESFNEDSCVDRATLSEGCHARTMKMRGVKIQDPFQNPLLVVLVHYSCGGTSLMQVQYDINEYRIQSKDTPPSLAIIPDRFDTAHKEAFAQFYERAWVGCSSDALQSEMVTVYFG
jgi:hypothetical protein